MPFAVTNSTENTTIQSLEPQQHHQPTPTPTPPAIIQSGVISQPVPTESSYVNQQSMLELVRVDGSSSPTLPTKAVNVFVGQYPTNTSSHISEESTLIVGDLSCLRDKFRPAPFVLNADIKYMRLVTKLYCVYRLCVEG